MVRKYDGTSNSVHSTLISEPIIVHKPLKVFHLTPGLNARVRNIFFSGGQELGGEGTSNPR